LTSFGTNIPDTAGHQTALQVPTSSNICFYTTILNLQSIMLGSLFERHSVYCCW